MRSGKRFAGMYKQKYRAVKVESEYGTFDSKREYKRFLYLKDLEDKGEIHDLRRQVPFELIPKQELKYPVQSKGKTRKTALAVKYYADFTYYIGDTYIVEDAKGVKTDVYQIKFKLMLERYGIQIKEV